VPGAIRFFLDQIGYYLAGCVIHTLIATITNRQQPVTTDYMPDNKP
jgi:hypothetical protein